MGTMIPLGDASRRPLHRSVVTAVIILVNALVFALELRGGESFVTRWSAIPADIVAGHHWITLLTAMFMHASWSHIIGNRSEERRVGKSVDLGGRRIIKKKTAKYWG